MAEGCALCGHPGPPEGKERDDLHVPLSSRKPRRPPQDRSYPISSFESSRNLYSGTSRLYGAGPFLILPETS